LIGPEQGWSVSLSSDGNTAIVGDPFDNNQVGAAWVYTRSGGVWSQQAKLVATSAIGPAGQGYSVSLSSDGNTAIVGGPLNNAGAAWVFIRSGGVWSQQAKLVGGTGAGGVPFQGWSVSLSGDGNTAIIGDIGDSGIGAAWVFIRSGSVWNQQAKLIGAGGVGEQGYSVSLSSDGNTAIVGDPTDNSSGSAWVFTRSASVWSQQAKLVGTVVSPYIAEQEYSVSLSGDGNTAIVGGPYDNNNISQPGAAWVFTRSAGVWSQQAKLVASNAIGNAEQGNSVSLSRDGNIAIVGGPFDGENTGNLIGAAWVYARSDGVWSQQTKLVGTGANVNAAQGYSVSLSTDGSTVIVGAYGDAAWVFAQPAFAVTPGKANCFGQSVSALARQYGGLNGAAAALGYSGVNALQNAILAFCGG
jgi:hypothetical protein